MILNCIICERPFKTYLSKVKIGRGKYCSRRCSNEITLIKKGEHKSKGTEIKTGQRLPKEWVDKMIGRIPWNRGKNWERKLKSGIDTRIKKGQHLSSDTEFKKGSIPKHAGKNRPELAGEKHWNWQGGKGQRPIVTFKYKNWRKRVFERDNYTCIMCGKRGGDINADHIKLWSLYPRLRYRVSNGRTLCLRCHKKVTFSNKLLYHRNPTGRFMKVIDANNTATQTE